VPAAVPNVGRINTAVALLVTPFWTIGTRSPLLTASAGGRLEILMLMDYPMLRRWLASVLRKSSACVNILAEIGMSVFLY
jgi:hypothetical protein